MPSLTARVLMPCTSDPPEADEHPLDPLGEVADAEDRRPERRVGVVHPVAWLFRHLVVGSAGVVPERQADAFVGRVVEQLRMAGDNQVALLMLDRELGQRSPEEEA